MATFLNDLNFLSFYLSEHSLIRYLLVAVIVSILLAILIAGRVSKSHKNKSVSVGSSDIDMSDIAGEDVIATQLDLAKAYIEMNQAHMAKQILNNALKKGNSSQQQQARQLIDTL